MVVLETGLPTSGCAITAIIRKNVTKDFRLELIDFVAYLLHELASTAFVPELHIKLKQKNKHKMMHKIRDST